MVKNKIKRSIPLLLALVVLISCLPVTSAFADEIYWLDGTWKFNSDISWDSDFDFFYPSFVSIEGSQFDAFNYIYSESELWLYNQGEDVCAYDSGSWNGPLPVVWFSKRVQVTKAEYDFFQTNLRRTSSSITINGVTETFTSAGSAPNILMQVSDTGAVFSAAGKTFSYVYDGVGTFLGFSPIPSGDPAFTPGNSYELAAGSHTLYPISGALLPDQITTTVNIYNNAGTQLLYSFKASDAHASPRVTVAPSASSITFTVPDQDPVVFSGVYSSFTGLALKPQATAPAVVLGQTLSIGGTSSDTVVDLYCTYERGFVDPSDTDFVSWLATAVGGFLSFELWPGMSLDQVLWVILVIGILMWFLKVIM